MRSDREIMGPHAQDQTENNELVDCVIYPVSGTHSRFWVGLVERAAVADDIVDANTNGESNTTVDSFAVHFFGVKLRGSSFHNGSSEFAQIQDLGADNSLGNKSLQRKIHNLRCFLVFGAHITTFSIEFVEVTFGFQRHTFRSFISRDRRIC